MFEVEDERPTVTIATFSHGKLKKKKHKKIKFLSYQQNQNQNEKRKRILVGKTDSISYVGANFNAVKSDYSEMYKHYIGILNKTTGKMQICDVDLFNLHPKFPETERQNENISDSLDLSYMQQKLKLTNTFGTVASRRFIDNYKKTVVEGAMLDDAIDGVLERTLNAENQADVGAETVQPNLLPPCNANAESPQDVYNLSDIISPAEMGCLQEYSKDIFNFKPEDMDSFKTDNIYYPCVLSRLQSLPPLGSPERQTKADCLQYLQYMVSLQQMTKYTIKSKDFFTYFPPIVGKQFIGNFLQLVRNPKGALERQTTAALKDKLAIYLLILLLVIDNFNLSFDAAQKELNIKSTKLRTLFGYIGCEIQKQKGSTNKNVVLTAPLKLTTPHKIKSRRRR